MKKLLAEELRDDPRIKEAKNLLLAALQDHTASINHIEPADPERVKYYQNLIERMGQARGAPLFYPFLGSGIGNGSFVELLDGSIKYDMITGIGVHFMGHSSPEMAEAAFDAALSDTIMQGNLQQNRESLEVMDLLIKTSGLPHCFLTTSGVMANENAVKVAFQHNQPAARILAFEHCFAGRSWSFSQVTDKPAYRVGLPLNVNVDYVPYYDEAHPEASTELAIRTLKKHIERYPKSHAVMIFELVQGEAGFYVGSRPFFEALMKICKENNIAVFSDEIQTFARTAALYAFQYFQLEEYVDILAIGKLSQVCATLFRDSYAPKPGLLSQTFTGSSSSLFACRTLLDLLIHGDYYGKTGRMAEIHERFEKHLKSIENEFPGKIKGPYGIGAMIAFTPGDGKHETTLKFVHELYNAGVLSFIAGNNPTRVRFLVPALVITDEQIDAVMQIVRTTIQNVIY